MPAPRLPLVFGAALLAVGGCSDRSVRHINSVPTATIVSPLEGAEVLEGSTVEMRGEVGDYEDDPEDLDIHWMVGNERVCADSSTAEAAGATACETVLTESGTLTLKVFDTESESSEDFIDIVVLPNEAPAIEIASPEDGDRGYSGEKFTLFATVSDDHDAPGDLELAWLADDIVLEPIGGSLDADGEYTGSLDVDDLEPGTYTLKATVTDGLGKAKSDSVEITVFGPNIDPSCEISAPEEDEVFTTEDTVTIKGTCADEETTANLLDVVIESGTDGVLAEDVLIASSGAFSEVVGPLSEGTHALSVTVTDDYGTQGAAIVTIEVCGEAWYEDADGDGYGNAEEPVLSCEQLSGYVTDSTDCDDDDVFTYPGAADKESSTDCMTDADEDGYGDSTAISPVTAGTDCDDSDADISPLASEICDGVDNDCDGDEDDDDSDVDTSQGGSTFYADTDGDGYGDAAATIEACDEPSGYTSDDTDCDDDDSAVNPGATEVCDGTDTDDDCDGDVNEDDSSLDTSTTATYYADTDGDSYGDSSDSQTVCSQPTGYVSDDTDCHDGDEHTYPGAASSEGSSTDCMTDADGDGYGDDSPVSGVTAGTDCDDDESAVSPAATEECDDIDNDCDDDIDDDDSDLDTSTATTWYADSDSDGYSDSATSQTTCDQPSGYIEASSSADCDDSDEFTYPGAADKESSTDCMTDADEDGYGDSTAISPVTAGTDCDDGDEDISPLASEICDGVDNDCDGDEDDDDSSLDTSTASTWYADSDGDGFGDEDDLGTLACDQPSGMVADHDDCDDGDGDVNPDETEVCDEDDSDEDCNGVADDDDSGVDTSTMSDWYADTDGDSYGDSSDSQTVCNQPDGYVSDDTDCDDGDEDTYPGVASSEGSSTDCMTDADGDGYGDDSPVSGVTAGTDCDDDESAVSPAATEECDDIDNDCDDDIDDADSDLDTSTATTWYADSDSDGYSDSATSQTTCDQPSGYIEASSSADCDDSDEFTYPGVAFNESSSTACMTDADEDGYGDDSPVSGVTAGTDCDDGDEDISPLASEICDGVDNDCDGDEDDDDSSLDTSTASTWYADSDGDGFGDEDDPGTLACEQPSGMVDDHDDCDDGDDGVNPDETEVCDEDNSDEDCNGVADDDDSGVDTSTMSDWYTDSDGDDYGDEDGSATTQCDDPGSSAADNTDCDDTADNVNPGEVEVCDGVDNDCDGNTDVGLCGDFTLSEADATYTGKNSGDQFGISFSMSGDIDGDGQDDLVVGANYYDNTSTDDGAVYIYYGPTTSGGSTGAADGSLLGTGADQLGNFVDSSGDLDGDGYDDMVLCESVNDDAATNAGAAYVVYGPISGSFSSSASSYADGELQGSNSTDLLCSAARIVADIDDDGLAELFVGIGGYDGGSYSNSGAAMVWYGSGTDPFSSVTDVFSSGASGGYDIYIDGDANNDFMGNAAAEGGDIDGDGFGDLVVGSYGYGTGGAALLMYGPLSSVGNIAGADVDVRFLGQNSNDYVGYWISTGGDATGDGQTDLLVGDYRGYDSSGSTRMGAAYLFSSGSYSGDVSVDSYNAVLYGSAANDAFSYDTLLADIDGDGTADAVLGAYLNDDGGSNAGAVYVVFGPLSGSYEVSTDADVEILGDTAGYRTGLAIRSGDVNGDGIEDIGISSPYATGSNTGQIDLFFGGLQ